MRTYCFTDAFIKVTGAVSREFAKNMEEMMIEDFANSFRITEEDYTKKPCRWFTISARVFLITYPKAYPLKEYFYRMHL